jgi:hypothetical protein
MIMSFEVDAPLPLTGLKKHPTSRSPLFRVKVVGRLHAHRPIFPVGSGEAGPISPLPDVARSADEALPQTADRKLC